MKETTRTILLLVLLTIAVGFILWVRGQNEAVLDSGTGSGRILSSLKRPAA